MSKISAKRHIENLNRDFHDKNMERNLMSSLNYLRRATADLNLLGDVKLKAKTLMTIKAHKHLLNGWSAL